MSSIARGEDKERGKSAVIIHYQWVIAVLLAIIIILLTERLATPEQEQVLTQLNFAATISSLILAVLAIVYAALESLRSSHHANIITTEIGKLATVTTQLNNIQDNLIASRRTVETISSDLQSLKPGFVGQNYAVRAEASSERGSNGSPIDLSDADLRYTSDNGLIALLIMAHQSVAQKQVSLEEIARQCNTLLASYNQPSIDFGYLAGFVLGLACANNLQVEGIIDSEALNFKAPMETSDIFAKVNGEIDRRITHYRDSINKNRLRMQREAIHQVYGYGL